MLGFGKLVKIFSSVRTNTTALSLRTGKEAPLQEGGDRLKLTQQLSPLAMENGNIEPCVDGAFIMQEDMV